LGDAVDVEELEQVVQDFFDDRAQSSQERVISLDRWQDFAGHHWGGSDPRAASVGRLSAPGRDCLDASGS
jgi:hypothetical protein